MLTRILQASRRLPVRQRLRAMLRMRLARTFPRLFPQWSRPGMDPIALTPRPADPGGLDWIFFGIIDWHFRFQRPQHFAAKLVAKGHRVFYVSSTLIPNARPGFRVEPIDPSGFLFQIWLNASDVPDIYYGLPSAQAEGQLSLGCKMALDWARSAAPIALVHHPFWLGTAGSTPHALLVYDRLDYHQGFGDWAPELGQSEEVLIRQADLTVVSSVWLDRETARLSDHRVLIRNAGDYRHFATPPDAPFADPRFATIIGYYGAIAPWLDLDLVEAVARAHPDSLVLLIGHDQIGAGRRLRRYPNIRLIGEVAYQDLPHYLYGFDVCLLPFLVTPLTLATNPVKAYEYLGAGLPIVSTDLPEMRELGELVYVGSSTREFLDGVAQALREPAEDPIRGRRQAYAELQTWQHRAKGLLSAVRAALDERRPARPQDGRPRTLGTAENAQPIT